jgi:hypothetical protein
LQNFSRIGREEPPSYAPSRHFQDDSDADPFVKGRYKMGPTYVRHPGKFSLPHPANDVEVVNVKVHSSLLSIRYYVDLPSASANPPVLEHVAPLSAEVGQEFLDNLASRGRKDKAPTPEAGPSEAPPAKRKKKGSAGPYGGRKRRH